MKRTVVSLITSLLLSASAWSGSGVKAEPKTQVVTTLNVLKYLAEQVGGSHVNVVALSNPLQDPHFIEPRPTLMNKARKADLFVEIGLDLELWAGKVLEGAANNRINRGQPGYVAASQGVATMEIPANLTRDLGDVHPYGNPHIWLDPLNAKIMAGNIAQGLIRVDAKHKADYEKNLADFDKRIDAKMIEWRKLAVSAKNKTFVSYHKTFPYFAQCFGLKTPIQIEEKPGISPSARHRDAVIALMKNEPIGVILLEVYYDKQAANFIANQAGAKVVSVPIDVGSTANTSTYFGLIDSLLGALQ